MDRNILCFKKQVENGQADLVYAHGGTKFLVKERASVKTWGSEKNWALRCTSSYARHSPFIKHYNISE